MPSQEVVGLANFNAGWLLAEGQGLLRGPKSKEAARAGAIAGLSSALSLTQVNCSKSLSMYAVWDPSDEKVCVHGQLACSLFISPLDECAFKRQPMQLSAQIRHSGTKQLA